MAEKTQYIKPFWRYEFDLQKMRNKLESDCYEAKTLKEALDTGVNSVYLIENYKFYDRTNIGYLDENGEYVFCSQIGRELDLNTPVEFYGLETDDDGYTIALFNKKGEK